MISTLSLKKINNYYPILVISLCASFLFYKFILQIYPSIITDQLMRELKLSGAGLGNLAATFYYSYIVTQLLVGILLDKFSTRWLTSAAIVCCAVGLILFSESHTVLTAALSRSLMGVGVAFATVSYMKLAAVWFSPKHYAFIGGLLATAAMSGAVFGEAPLNMLINEYGWRNCLYDIGFAGIVLAILFWMIVRDTPTMLVDRSTQKSNLTWQSLLQVIKNKQNWLLTIYSGLAFSPLAIFGGLWGNPFLQQAYHLTKIQTSSLLSLIFIGLGIGSPLLGMLADYLGKRQLIMLVSTLASCIALLAVLYIQPMPSTLLGVLLFIFGFGLGAFMLVFTIGKEINHISLTATVIAMINTSDAILDSISEPGIGKLLDLTADQTIVNGVRHFSLHSYHMVLSILPIYLLIACVLLFWVKDRK